MNEYDDDLPMTCDNRPGAIYAGIRRKLHSHSPDLSQVTQLTDSQKLHTLDCANENSAGHKQARAVIETAIEQIRELRLKAMLDDNYDEGEQNRLARERMRKRRRQS
jgi:hypothetical protein